MADYTNSELYRVLSQIAKDYEKILEPYRSQMERIGYWKEEADAITRMAKAQQLDLSSAIGLDAVANAKLKEIAAPYQVELKQVLDRADLFGTQFSELIKPQIYIPGNVIKNPWQVETAFLKSLDSTPLKGLDSSLAQLLDTEKAIANLPVLSDLNIKMTSISAQIASIQRSGLTESWKKAILPEKLISNLSEYAIKQYKQIKKDSRDAKWRLGLVSAASAYVDRRAEWGTQFAISSGEDAPTDTESKVPDFNELGTTFSSAKRLDKDVNIYHTQMEAISDKGKIIIEKAQVINDFCQSRGQSDVFPNRELLSCAIVIVGTYCREPEDFSEVMKALRELFVREEISNRIGEQECFADIERYCGSTVSSAAEISKTQLRIYRCIIEVEDKLIEKIREFPIGKLSEDAISREILKSLIRIQSNKIYYGVNENTLNDAMRDQLSVSYIVRDQSRQGISTTGKDAGEVDILICNDDIPVCIIEALKVDSVQKDNIQKHINKALVEYDPIGLSQVYVVIYATVENFDNFWNKLCGIIQFPYEVETDLTEIATNYTGSRHARSILRRDGKHVSAHIFAVKMPR